MLEDGSVIPAIIEKRKSLSPQHALLVGISGIDASGKGFVTTRIAESLQKRVIKLAPDGIQTALSNSKNAISFSSACTTKRFLSSRCASATKDQRTGFTDC